MIGFSSFPSLSSRSVVCALKTRNMAEGMQLNFICSIIIFMFDTTLFPFSSSSPFPLFTMS